MTGLAGKIRPFAGLCKPLISSSTTLSAGAASLLAGGKGPQIITMIVGVFLLACGACGLNQYQDRGIDALMARTAGRPLPSGLIRPRDALAFSVTLLLAGSILLLSRGLAPFLLGLLAVLWYNGFYTYFKRRTAFAAIPGAVIGALPVAIGWVSAGGDILDPKMAFFCFFFFMWQVPHFWLLAAEHAGEYEKAGLPSLTCVFRQSQLSRLNFIWMSAAGVSCILMAAAGVTRNNTANLAVLGLSLWIIWSGAKPLWKRESVARGSAGFKRMNIYMVFVTILLAADRFV